jgi:hypothetical protein
MLYILGSVVRIGEAAQTLVDALHENGADWVSDGYRLANSWCGVKVWIANAAYALHVEDDNGSVWKPNPVERSAIWHAVKPLLRGKGNILSRKIAKKLAS